MGQIENRAEDFARPKRIALFVFFFNDRTGNRRPDGILVQFFLLGFKRQLCVCNGTPGACTCWSTVSFCSTR
jgi:hypothetical protein